MEKEVVYTVTQEEAQTIMNGLTHLPWGLSDPLIRNLQAQATEQLAPPPPPPEEKSPTPSVSELKKALNRKGS